MVWNWKQRTFGWALSASGIALAASLAMVQEAHAETTSSIQGVVNGAKAGDVVTATDTQTGQKATATVRDGGRYVLVGLRPSTYHVEVNGQPAQDVTVPVASAVVVDFGGSAEATIVVTGQRRQETRSATVSTSLSPKQIETLPNVGRNFLNNAALAPGLVVSGNLGDNNKKIQAGGVASSNINVLIDGVSNKDLVNGNGVAGQSFSQGSPFPQSSVQEFKVETQNFKAEYDQAGSAVITAVTKTGGSEFHGGAYYSIISKDMYGQPYFSRNQPKPDIERKEYGGNVGGPIIPGVLHFFVDYEASRYTQPGATLKVTDALVPSKYKADNGLVPYTFDEDNWFGKLTWFATANDTVNLSYFKRDEADLRDLTNDVPNVNGGALTTKSHGRSVATTADTIQIDWKHRGENWVNELSVSRFKSDTPAAPLVNGPEFTLFKNNSDVTNPTSGTPLVVAGSHFFGQRDTQELTTVKDEFTFTGYENHVIKAGFKFAGTTLGREENFAGSGRYYYSATPLAGTTGFTTFTDFTTNIPIGVQISSIPAGPVTADDNQYGVFIQDDWTVDDHWTVNYGIRWDYEDNAFNNDYKTPAAVAAGLRAYQPWKAAGINAENFITDGSKRDPFTGAFQPRIGVSYDVNGDRDMVIFGGAGRYYDRNIFLAAIQETLTNSQTVPTLTFCNGPTSGQGLPACTGSATELKWNDAYRDPNKLRAAIPSTAPNGGITVINNDAKMPYTDSFNFGVRKRFGDWQTSATVAYNYSHDAFQYFRANRMPDGSYTAAGYKWIRDNFPPEGQVPGYNGQLNAGSSKGEYKYLALYLTADKAYTKESGWGATGTLTIADAQSNTGHNFGDVTVFNAGTQTAWGWQDTVGLEKWRFVGSAIYDLPWDFEVSGVLTLSSGPSFGSIRPDPGPDLTYPAGCPAWSCVYMNDSGVYTPDKFIAFKNLDLRLSKTFKLWKGNELTVDADVYNVFDWVNRSYSTWGAGFGSPAPLTEDNTVGYARTYQVGARYKF